MSELIDELSIIAPDDFHHHLRDGDTLANVVAFAAMSFKRVLAMPNIKPPVRNLEEVCMQ
jgi:dihydroorotase